MYNMFHALFVSQISRKMNEPNCHWVLGEGRLGFESPQVNEYLRSPKRERERERERERNSTMNILLLYHLSSLKF